MAGRSPGSKARNVLALVLAAGVLASLLWTPVSAHFTTNTRHLGVHAWNQVVRPRGDNRWLRSHLRYVRSAEVAVADGALGFAEAVCPSGWVATGGGGTTSLALAGIEMLSSFPSNGGGVWGNNAGFRGWAVEIRNGSASATNIRAYVVCARPNRTRGSNYTPGANPAFTGVEIEGR